MGEWARARSLPAYEVTRWEAAAWLHDALRDADPGELRALLPPADRELPDALLHGPAAAVMIEGLVDPSLAEAVRYHTTGHPALGTLGRALYAADFLEPGRDFAQEWRAGLRARMPHDLDRVVHEIAESRLEHLRGAGHPVRPESAAFHASLAAGGA
jgi:HD superfamily phosphohydrolase YqeK